MGNDGSSGIEWLDDEGRPAAPDEELPGGNRRPPLRRRTKITFVAVAVAALAAVVTVGVIARPDDATPRAQPSATPTTSSVRVPFPGNADHRNRLSSTALAAIRGAFPKAELQSFVFVPATTVGAQPTNFYNLTSEGRTITVRVTPLRRTDVDLVSRNATSVELGQQLGRAFIDIVVRRGTRRPSAADFDAMQDLVQDARLLTR